MPDVPPALDEAAALRAANARLREVIEAKDAEAAVLRAQLQACQAQLEQLHAEVEALHARLRQNPRNSSRPPSSEGPAKPAPRSVRRRSGRKPGRPKGQPGATLEMTDQPDEVAWHEPDRCAGCGAGLSGAPLARTEKRQVIDLPEQIRALVTEHWIISRRCCCGTVTAGAAPPGVAAPVQYGPRITAVCAYLWHGQFLSRDRTCQAMGELFGVPVSPGAVAGMVRRIAGAIGGCTDTIRRGLAGAPVAHFDETGFRSSILAAHSKETEALTRLRILSPPSVVKAAHILFKAEYRLAEPCFLDDTPTDSYDMLILSVRQCRAQFIEAARSALGLRKITGTGSYDSNVRWSTLRGLLKESEAGASANSSQKVAGQHEARVV